MGENVTESTMKYKVDISELKADMQQAQRTIKVANSEFKAASALMDDWAKSSDGLGAKLQQLDTVMSAQKTILNSLEGQYKQVELEQGKNSKAAQDLIIKINNQKAAISKTENQVETYTHKLDELKESNKEADGAVGKLNTSIQEQETHLASLKNEYQKTTLEYGKNSSEAKKLKTEIDTLNVELQSNKDKLKDAAYAADDLGNELDSASNDAKGAEGGFTVLKGALADLASEGIKIVIEGLKELVTENDRASSTFQAATGATTESMAKYNEEMQKLYNSGAGDSLEDIALAMAEIKQQTNELDPSSLEKMTNSAIALRDTFGFEIKDSVRAANMMVEQFGYTNEEAFNLLAQGAQKGLDKNGDLLDSINEYAPYYQRMGVSGEQFFNSLLNGAAAGTFSVDKLGDAYKEFNIRVQDTANTTTEGFELLGLNADEMRRKFSEGGESAKKATEEVLASFNSMEDPVKKNLAGVDLWGTMYEDLGEKGVMALMNLNGTASSTANTMEDIKKVKYDDVGSQFTQLGRTMKSEILTPFAKELLPVLKDGINWTKQNLNGVIPVLKTVGTAVSLVFAVKTLTLFRKGIVDIGDSIGNVSKTIPVLGSALGKLGAFIMTNPWGALATAILGVGLAVVALGEQESEQTKAMKEEHEQAIENRKAWDELTDSKKNAIEQAVSEIDYTQRLKDELVGLVDENGRVKDGYAERAGFITGELNNAYGTEISIIDGVIQKYSEQMETLDAVISKKRAAAIIEAGHAQYTKALQGETKAWDEVATAQTNYENQMKQWDAVEKTLRDRHTSEEQIASTKRIFMNSEELEALKGTVEQKKVVAQGYTDTIAQQEYLQTLMARGNAEDIAKINEYVSKTYDDKGQKIVLTTQQQITNETNLMEYLQKRYKETGDNMYTDQINASQQRLDQLNTELTAQKTTVEEKTPSIATAWENMSKNGLQSMKSNSQEYKNAAIEQTILAKQGINEGTDETNAAWKYLSDQGLAKFEENQWQYTTAGEDMVEGVKIGIENRRDGVFGVMWGLGKGLIQHLRDSIESKSPSRAAMRVGGDWDDGLIIGLKKGMPEIMEAVELPLDKLKKSTSNININNKMNDITSKAQYNPIPQTIGQSVNFNQTINSPKALSRLEIYRQTNTLLFGAKVGLKK